MGRDIRKVVVLGANGAMGAGSGEVFAAAGIPTVFLARTTEKAETGLERAVGMAKADAVAAFIRCGSYDDLAEEVADADMVFEAVAETLPLKQQFFERVDAARKPGSLVATVSSGLSLAAMCEGRSADFAKNFLGIHFFNPPNVIVGCELIPHAGTDPKVTAFVEAMLDGPLGREVVRTTDTPAFAGNRVGFKVLNEVAQLAEEHGVAFIDALIGSHTGRAMAPLSTIDFVGWDVHKAIVDNLYEHTADEAHAAFALPPTMAKLIEAGHLGRKTPAKGGFFKKVDKTLCAYDYAKGEYRPLAETRVELPAAVSQMKTALRVGRYEKAWDIFAEAKGREMELMRRVILGYVSYGLNRVGEVVAAPRDVDRIMGFGFNWAPPSAIVDMIGARRTVALLEAAGIPVPKVVVGSAEKNQTLFNEPGVDVGRFFFA